MSVLLITIIALALIFDYINGFHDAANSIATVVSTKVLTPLQAVIWAAVFNFVAFFIFKDHGVANTIAKTVKEGADAAGVPYITLPVILSGLIAAIFWNLLTWWFGIPSSSSHTLIGGFAGAAIAHAGFNSINPEPVIKTVCFIVLAPLLGMIIAFIISVWFINSFRKGWLPRIISLAVIAGVIYTLSSVMVTDASHLAGIKLDKGLRIKEIGYNSNAQKMGLRKGDSIVAVDNLPVSSSKELNKSLKPHQKGDAITFNVLRKDKVTKIDQPYGLSTTYQPKFESKLWTFIFYGENFKWLLLALILVSMSLFTMFLNTLNVARSQAWFKRMQLVSSAAFSIGHGGNDAQKVMGIIMVSLVAFDPVKFHLDHMEWWVPLSCYAAISLGTVSGGWKIIKTMGTRITKVTPFEGVAAETAGAITLFLTEQLKIPVSTTHTITGSIIGVGATKRLSAVRWGVTVNLLWAWILTIPISAIMAAVVYYISTLFIK